MAWAFVVRLSDESKAGQAMFVAHKKKRTRRGKIVLWVFVGMLTFATVRFFVMRVADRTAWPEGVVGVSLTVSQPPTAVRLASPADVEAVLNGWTEATPGLLDAYREYQIAGVGASRTQSMIDARLVDPGARLVEGLAFWARFDGFDATRGSMPYATWIGVSAEHAILAAYAASAGRSIPGLPADVAGARLTVLANAIKMTHGGGLMGRFAALNNVMLVVREWIMDPVVFADQAAAAACIAHLRDLEARIGSLEDALRTDLRSLDVAVGVIYGHALDSAATGARPMGRMGRFVVRRLGGTHADTQANLDALFSRLIVRAARPYAETGLAEGLPAWCRGEGRAPATRDPIGAAVAGAYMRHARSAHAVGPSLLMELRAVRLALALAHHAREAGAYPETVQPLIDAGLLTAADVLDPFSPDGAAPFVYARDEGGWRFYSVGLNQMDGGGAVDAFRAPDAASQQHADFVFASRERALRRNLPPGGGVQPVADERVEGEGD